MKRAISVLAGSVFLLAAMAVSHSAQPDFELKGPDGRQILLKDDGTWRYLEKKPEASADKSKAEGELVLSLERKIPRAKSCRFAVRLANNTSYPVGSLVLYYSAYRKSGAVYDTVSSGIGFNSLKPGDTQSREFEFYGLPCDEITRVQVVGGDRCDMGELTRWSDQSEFKGKCLAQVRVAESKEIRFDK